MTKEEIIKFLKESLDIDISVTTYSVRVSVFLCGEEIASSTDSLPDKDSDPSDW